MEKQAPVLFEEAKRKLQEANEELCRPEEDVVSYLVCKNSQFAIENYLKGYLIKHGIDPGKSATIDTLYAKCLHQNERFKELDLSDFTCKSQQSDSKSCNDTDKVTSCYNTAERLDSFLRQERILN